VGSGLPASRGDSTPRWINFNDVPYFKLLWYRSLQIYIIWDSFINASRVYFAVSFENMSPFKQVVKVITLVKVWTKVVKVIILVKVRTFKQYVDNNYGKWIKQLSQLKIKLKIWYI
jgi:hypothetical protein